MTDYIRCEQGDANGVLVVDETGFVKKGFHSAGCSASTAARPGASRTAQVGVFLVYASCHERALLNRELYLGRKWIEDAQRRQAGKIPDRVAFHTKPQ